MRVIVFLFVISMFLSLDFLASDISLSKNKKEYWLFIGNSGVGKSTIVNALSGEEVAEAGVSVCGLTTTFKSYEDKKNNRYYLDTPGLADPEMKEQAAKEIEKALKQEGSYKIFFVLTLETGRVKPEDIATINIVMNSIDIPQKSYSILVNKLKPLVKAILEEEKGQALLYAQLNSGDNKTAHICYINNDSELDKLDNKEVQLLSLSPEVHNFLAIAPSMDINKNQVAKIKVDDLEEVTKIFEEQITTLKKSFEIDKAMQEKVIQELQWSLVVKNNPLLLSLHQTSQHFLGVLLPTVGNTPFKDQFFQLTPVILKQFIKLGLGIQVALLIYDLWGKEKINENELTEAQIIALQEAFSLLEQKNINQLKPKIRSRL